MGLWPHGRPGPSPFEAASSGSLSRKPIGASPTSRCSSRRFANSRPTLPAPTISVGAGPEADMREATIDEIIPPRLAVRYTVANSQRRTPCADNAGALTPERTGSAIVAIAAIAVAPAIVRRSSSSCSRRRFRYRPPAASRAIVIAGKPTIHHDESASAPTARPPIRSTTTASVRTTPSANGASASHLRAGMRRAGSDRAARSAIGVESVVGSRIDTGPQVAAVFAYAAASRASPQLAAGSRPGRGAPHRRRPEGRGPDR